MGRGQAERLATAFGRYYAVHSRRWYETERNGPINWGALTACGRTMLALPSWNPRQDGPSPADRVASRNRDGAYWLVTLCAHSGPQLSVAVAASALELETRGRVILFPDAHGNEFVARGIPDGWYGALAVSPEEAAIKASTSTGSRVRSTPRLIRVDPAWIPQAAQWEVELDVPAAAAGHDALSQVYVGLPLDGTPAVGPTQVAVQVPPTGQLSAVASLGHDRGPMRMRVVGQSKPGGLQ